MKRDTNNKKIILGRGAEAIIEKEGGIVHKRRVSKTYRIEEIDKKLREERTKKEARIMERLINAGLPVPKLLNVSDFNISMEFIDGTPLVQVACEQKRIFRKVGEVVGKIHSLGICHGDLTTSNIIIKDGTPYIIDFGLGSFTRKIEDFAVDLHVLRQSIESKHYKCYNEIWKLFIKGYTTSFEKSQEVLQRLEVVESRGRYKGKKK